MEAVFNVDTATVSTAATGLQTVGRALSNLHVAPLLEQIATCLPGSQTAQIMGNVSSNTNAIFIRSISDVVDLADSIHVSMTNYISADLLATAEIGG